MSAINITNARKELYNLVEDVNLYSEPTLIVSKKGNSGSDIGKWLECNSGDDLS